jgi:16S rRNA (uracil1498-N3)-methyltransferase
MMSHKKIHRFMLGSIPSTALNGTITVTDSRITSQIFRVLKLKIGETVQLFANGGPEYTATITDTSPVVLEATVTAIKETVLPSRTVIAAVSIVKGDAFDFIVQKLTEIGVHTIVPIISNRTVKQSVRLERLQMISDEAVEQCGGTVKVHISEPLSLTECFRQFPYYSIALDPITTTTSLSDLPDTVVYYIGPEGGWDEKDEAILTASGAHSLKISERVLRTETAAILGVYTLLQ